MKTVNATSNLLRASLFLALLLAACLLLVAPASAAPQDDELTSSEETTASDEKVTLYMTSWCGWCRKTTALLDELGVEYRTVDIEKDSEGNTEFRRLGNGQGGIPLVNIDGTLVRGFKEADIRRLVGELEGDEKQNEES